MTTRIRNHLSIFSVLLLAMQWAAISAQAQTPVTACGTEITQPGQYILANDLLGCLDGILIRSEEVTLNLNSHRIVGIEAGGSKGISVSAKRGTIIDGPGTIARFFTGVYLQGITGGTVIDDMTVQDNHFGFFIASSREVAVGDSTVVSNQAGIVLFNSSNNRFVENKVNTNRGTGIEINGSRNEFILNKVENNGTYGIEVQNFYGAHNNRITFNTATGNSTFDLAERGVNTCQTWENNTFNSASRPCIH